MIFTHISTTSGQAALVVGHLVQTKLFAGAGVHLESVTCLIVTLPRHHVIILTTRSRWDLVHRDQAKAIPTQQGRIYRDVRCVEDQPRAFIAVALRCRGWMWTDHFARELQSGGCELLHPLPHVLVRVLNIQGVRGPEQKEMLYSRPRP